MSRSAISRTPRRAWCGRELTGGRLIPRYRSPVGTPRSKGSIEVGARQPARRRCGLTALMRERSRHHLRAAVSSAPFSASAAVPGRLAPIAQARRASARFSPAVGTMSRRASEAARPGQVRHASWRQPQFRSARLDRSWKPTRIQLLGVHERVVAVGALGVRTATSNNTFRQRVVVTDDGRCQRAVYAASSMVMHSAVERDQVAAPASNRRWSPAVLNSGCGDGSTFPATLIWERQ
jgi:hypothetical protein